MLYNMSKHGKMRVRIISKKGYPMKKQTFRQASTALFYLLSIGYLEMLLHIADRASGISGLIALRLLLSGAAAGALLWLVGTVIPQKTAARLFVGLSLFVLAVAFMANHCCQAFFGTYFQISYMVSMYGQVTGNFLGESVRTVAGSLWFFLLALVPFLLFLLFRKTLLPQSGSVKLAAVQIVLLLLLAGCSVLSCRTGGDYDYYTVDYTANNALPRFGLVQSAVLEVRYALFGKPLPEIHYIPTEPPVTEAAETIAADAPEEAVPAESPVVYGPNVMDIDFAALMEQSAGTVHATMDAYYASQTPTMQNEYTGRFAGKNLIFITAEAFCSSVIDPVRTPTLYRLATSGFVFENFFQPGWTQSTTGGEFANMTGLIPNWVEGLPAFLISPRDAMPMGMGWKFREQGYNCLAYHNGDYAYYSRQATHPNLGYTYKGIGNGLKLEHPNYMYPSDLELMEATVDDYISDYTENRIPFHAYYMTISGHAYYGFSFNDMSKKNAEAVEGLEFSETVCAYLAAQMELEYAMQYLVERLEQAGIANDTVIVLAADHYPYGLTQNSPKDYYKELTGVADSEEQTSRYRSTLILWCGDMEEPVVVDAPCSSLDIMPTLYNLFGISYDSRLLSGKDILAPTAAPGEISTAMPIVVFPSYGNYRSWITNAGIYEGTEDVFYPFPGVEVSDTYVADVTNLTSDRWAFSRMVIESDYFRHVFPDWVGNPE